MIHRLRWISYARVGYLLHMVTLIEIFILFYLYDLLQLQAWLLSGLVMLKIVTLLPFVIPPVIAQLDARSRFQNYKQIKDHLYLHGFHPRLIRPFIKSRCQRDAVMTAAQELGIGGTCRAHFHLNGYRWYHLLPDILFKTPRQLLGRSFWQTTLFTKLYRSKVNFREIALNSKKGRSGIAGSLASPLPNSDRLVKKRRLQI